MESSDSSKGSWRSWKISSNSGHLAGGRDYFIVRVIVEDGQWRPLLDVSCCGPPRGWLGPNITERLVQTTFQSCPKCDWQRNVRGKMYRSRRLRLDGFGEKGAEPRCSHRSSGLHVWSGRNAHVGKYRPLSFAAVTEPLGRKSGSRNPKWLWG